MINPNNTRQLAESLTEILDTIIPEQQLSELTQKQRNYLAVLINKWKLGENVIGIMKDILRIRSLYDKRETFLKMKIK